MLTFGMEGLPVKVALSFFVVVCCFSVFISFFCDDLFVDMRKFMYFCGAI